MYYFFFCYFLASWNMRKLGLIVVLKILIVCFSCYHVAYRTFIFKCWLLLFSYSEYREHGTIYSRYSKLTPNLHLEGFSDGSVVKACLQSKRARRWGFNPWVGKIPWSKWKPIPVFLPGKSHEWRSLMGSNLYSQVRNDWTQHSSSYILTWPCSWQTLDESERREWKNWLKTQHSGN